MSLSSQRDIDVLLLNQPRKMRKYRILRNCKPFKKGDILILDEDSKILFHEKDRSLLIAFSLAEQMKIPIQEIDKQYYLDNIDGEYIDIGTMLHLIRKRSNITQLQLADIFSMSMTSIVNTESSTHTPPFNKLKDKFNDLGYELTLKLKKKKVAPNI